MLHNKELEKQLNVVLNAIRLSKDDLFIQYDDHEKYTLKEDQPEILSDIQKHLDALEEAEEIVRDWALKLDTSIDTRNF